MGADVNSSQVYLANNEKLIQLLSESYPIRRAARFTARMFLQAKYYRELKAEGVIKPSDSPLTQIIEKIKKAFQDRNKNS